MNEIAQHDFGLLRREFKDARAVLSRLDHQMRQRGDPANHRTPQDMIAKLLTCHAIGMSRNGRSPAAAAAELYRNDAGVLTALAAPGMIGKAAQVPASTTGVGWAIELATPAIHNVDFLQLLAPTSVYSQLSSHPGSIRVNLVGYGSVKVPSRAPTPTLAAPFISEGSPIPVRSLALSSATLSPRKAAVISMFTREMLAHSTPNVESLVRATMAFDTATAIDSVLLGSAASSAIQPAGILNGVSATTATVGGGLAAFAGDVRALALAIEATGPLMNPVLLMSTTSAMLLTALTMNADLPIIASASVPPKQLILVDAANFASGEGDEPDISTSKEALLHEESDAPLPIVGGTATPPLIASVAAPVRSIYQTDCVAVRLLQDATWGMTRTGRVAFVNVVSW